jgi:hypothetical protein
MSDFAENNASKPPLYETRDYGIKAGGTVNIDKLSSNEDLEDPNEVENGELLD